MADDLNPLDAMRLKSERTPFVFCGWKRADRSGVGGPYFKLADSFSEAYSDLLENEAVQNAFYIVNDIFMETAEDDGPTLHIELRDLADALEGL